MHPVERDLFQTAAVCDPGALATNARESITAAHIGVAGAGDPSARRSWNRCRSTLRPKYATRVGISHDLKIAHAGGFAGRVGSALVAGTGSACYGVDSQGSEILTGGWGDLIDDAGSGSWIGLRALQLCVRQADGRAAGNKLQRAVLRFLGLDSVDEIKGANPHGRPAPETNGRSSRRLVLSWHDPATR